MKVGTIDNYFVRCDRPGCMNGFLGYEEPCEKCGGSGVVIIPELRTYFQMRKVIGYAGLIALASVALWAMFR